MAIEGEAATLTLANEEKTYDVRLATKALNEQETVAYTLIGARDTAILIVFPASCNANTHAAHLLTQQNQSPILITGCCVLDD